MALPIDDAIKKYKSGMSPYEISEAYKKLGLKCYPNLIRRALIKYGYKPRGKSEAQELALKTGRTDHPTKGKHHSSEVRAKIGKSIYDVWDNLSDEERAKRSKISKDKWDAMTPAEKEIFRRKAALAIRKAADYGSKIEKALLYGLRKEGYHVDFHTRLLTPAEKFQVDLFIRELGVVVEVDGLSHFEPIWGEEALARTKLADNEKNGLLLGKGYVVIRLQTRSSNISEVYKRKLLDKVLSVLYNIGSRTNIPIEERLIYIDDQ